MSESIKIISKSLESVKSPLGFFAVVLIMLETLLGLSLIKNPANSILILIIMGVIFFIAIISVVILIFYRPSALYPAEYSLKEASLNALSAEQSLMEIRKRKIQLELLKNQIELLKTIIEDAEINNDTKDKLLKQIIKSSVSEDLISADQKEDDEDSK